MATQANTTWHLRGTVVIACNCDYGCPCNVNALSSHGDCEGGWTWHVAEGHHEGVRLDGLNVSMAADWPGAIHEGNGEALLLIDERADERQRETLRRFLAGQIGGPRAVLVNTIARFHGPRFVPNKVLPLGRGAPQVVGAAFLLAGVIVAAGAAEMPWHTFCSLVLAGSLVGVLLADRIDAQEGSPTADGAPIAVLELAPGVTAEVFAASPSAVAPGQTLYLARFTFQPGAEIFPHSHPGTTLLGVESGRFGWTLVAGAAHVVRGAAGGAAGPAEDLTKPGADVILEPGDAIFYEADVVHTARGAGDEPTVVLDTFILETGQPLLMPVDMAMGGTPDA